MRSVEIEQEPVELYKILKFENLVMSGGEAKHVIADGLVLLNGTVETRKRKKVFAGDVVTFAHEVMTVSVKKGEENG